MFSFYKHNERITKNDQWGISEDTFFASDNEKYLGFGNLVQLTRTTLNTGIDYSAMKLHKNLELVDIIIDGSIGFQDSLGQISSFPENTVQVVSAGTGIYLREFNAGESVAEKIQIGFLPDKLNQATIKTKALFNLKENRNTFIELISPNNASSLKLQQQAAVLIGEFEGDRHIGYNLANNSVGLFVYIIRGNLNIQNTAITAGEAVSIQNEEQTMLHIIEPSIVLLIEVEMIEQLENR